MKRRLHVPSSPWPASAEALILNNVLATTRTISRNRVGYEKKWFMDNSVIATAIAHESIVMFYCSSLRARVTEI